LRQQLLYKQDRTLTVLGLIILGGLALYLKQNEIAMGCTGALAAFLGGKLK